jgi:hypothetical protein
VSAVIAGSFDRGMRRISRDRISPILGPPGEFREKAGLSFSNKRALGDKTGLAEHSDDLGR